MDFMDEVMAALGDGGVADEAGDSSWGDLYVAVGVTASGALFGFEENGYGQRQAYRFSSLMKRDDWFREVSALVGPSGL